MKDLILQPYHRSMEEAVEDSMETGYVMHSVWMTLEEIERLYPIDRERIGFLEGATLVKHSNVGWSSYLTPSGADWFYEVWMRSCAWQFDVAFYEHVTGKAAEPLLKLSVIAVRQAWGIR